MGFEKEHSYQVVPKKKQLTVISQHVTFYETRTEKGTESHDGQKFTAFELDAKVKNVTIDEENDEHPALSSKCQLPVPTNNDRQLVMYPVDSEWKNTEVIYLRDGRDENINIDMENVTNYPKFSRFTKSTARKSRA